MTGFPLQLIGWVGSALLILSLVQSRMLTLRVLNLIAAIVLIGYNAALAVWPSAAMNVAVAGIDLFYLMALRARRRRTPIAPSPDPGADPDGP